MIQYIIDLLGKICIPVIIGAITFIIAKRQITNAGVTQFRQKWIDNLRDSISKYVAQAETISMLELNDDISYFREFKELAQTQHKIELMLNREESDHSEIIGHISDIRDLIHENKIDQDKFNEMIKALIGVSQDVLKREWKVVKKGK